MFKHLAKCTVCALMLFGFAMSAYAAVAAEPQAQSQNGKTVTVRGVVYDDQGAPLPGAGVMVKGTTKGTITDLDGRYQLNVGANDVLVFSFMGYKDQEVPVNGKTNVSASLVTDNVLEDAVVVGYGSIKKENLTGAVAQIDSKVFESRPVANAQLMIDGVIPNVQTAITDGHPARQTGLDVRGKSGSLSSLYVESDATTLILIDGVEGDLAYINPDDIESISVLKDAASAAIYGSRGPMGVILVTTKSASRKTERPIVTYSGSVNIGTPRSMPDLVTDGAEWAQVMVDAYKNFTGSVPNITKFGSNNKINGETYIENYKAWYADPANVGDTAIDKKGNYTYYGNTDWFDLIYKKRALSQTHNVSVSGNNGRSSYLISGRIYDYDGIVKGDADNYTTANLRTKLETQVFKWLRIKENLSYTHDYYDMAVSSGGDDLVTPQSQMLAWGNPTFVPYNPDGTFTAAGWRILSGMEGPYADKNYKNKTTQTFRTTTGATASFFDNHLRLNADFTYQTKSYDVKQQYVNILFSNQVDVMTPALAEKNLYKQAVKEQFKWINYKTFNAYGEYENTFGRHYLKAMVGYNYETRYRRDFEIRKRGLDGSKANPINPYWAATGEFGANDGEIGNKVKIYRNAGVFYRLNYNFAERYLIELDGRYDGSSYFSRNYQWHFFPAASVAWRVSQEPWWHINPMFISSLKFRASYGSLGDAMSVGAYAYQETLNPDTSDKRVINGSSNVSIYTIPGDLNSQFGWSTITTKDAGFDIGFLNNKLEITGDWFIRSNTNMVVPGEMQSVTFGSETGKGNYASLSTHGWELELNYHDSYMVAGRPLGLGLRVGLADNWTIVDEYPGDENNKVSDSASHYKGERLGEIWGYHVNPDCPIFQTQDQIDNAFGQGVPYSISMTRYHNDNKIYPGDVWLLDKDGDNDINFGKQTLDDHGDMEIIGNFYPRYQFSFGFDLSYANFFLNAQFNGVGKMDIPLQSDHLLYSGWRSNKTSPLTPITKWAVANSWTEDNPDAFFPALSLNGSKNSDKAYGLFGAKYQTLWSNHLARYPIDRYLINGAYINMQNIQFGYNIPKKVISKIGLDAAKIYFTGENLWNWSPMYKTYGRDFDVQTIVRASDDTIEGYSLTMNGAGGFQYPILRTYSFGVSLTFGGSALQDNAAAVAGGSTALASALAAANAALEAAQAKAESLKAENDKVKAQAGALQSALDKAVKAKDDCEARKPMAQRRAEALHLEDIYFEINQSVIRDCEQGKVDKLIEVLKANPDACVSITGYADQGTGTELRNLVLTKERAEVVAKALADAGIAAERIHTEFYGTEKDSSFTPENNRLAVCIVK